MQDIEKKRILMIDDELDKIINTMVSVQEELGETYKILGARTIAKAFATAAEAAHRLVGVIVDSKMPCNDSECACIKRILVQSEDGERVSAEFDHRRNTSDLWNGFFLGACFRTLRPYVRIEILSGYVTPEDFSEDTGEVLALLANRMKIKLVPKPADARLLAGGVK